MRVTKLACALAMVTLGCGGDDGPVAYGELPEQLAGSLCSYAFRCCDAAELQDQFGNLSSQITDEPSCRMVMAGFYRDTIADQEAVTAGRVHYDADRGGACVAAVHDAACGTSNQAFRDECGGVFTGAVAVGGTCLDDDECAAGGRCDQASADVAGVCVARVAVGMTCTTSGDECVETAHCVNDGATATCVADLPDGAACQFLDECASGYCDPTDHCGPWPASTACDGQ